MNVELVLSQLDSLIENRRTDLVEGYLREKMEEAAEEGDRRAVITLMNELISYYGGTGEFEKMVEYCQQGSPAFAGNGNERDNSLCSYASSCSRCIQRGRTSFRCHESLSGG